MPELAKPIQSGIDYLFRLLKIGAPYVVGPIATPMLNSVELAIKVVRDGQNARRYDRTELLLESLATRLGAVEQEVAKVEPSPEHVDLFHEFMAKAIDDEGKGKSDLYAAFMTWILEKKPDVIRARILGDAIRMLSIQEIRAFMIEMVHGVAAKETLERTLSRNRLMAAGLTQGVGVSYKASPSEIGVLLKDIWPEGASREFA